LVVLEWFLKLGNRSARNVKSDRAFECDLCVDDENDLVGYLLPHCNFICTPNCLSDCVNEADPVCSCVQLSAAICYPSEDLLPGSSKKQFSTGNASKYAR